MGTGAWGTTLAILLARSGPVTLLARSAQVASAIAATRENLAHLPGVSLPEAVIVTADEGLVSAARELVVMAVPAAHMRESAGRIGSLVRTEAVVLSVAKGIEAGSLARMSEILATELPVPAERIAALSGPNLAPEIARGMPAGSVVGATDDGVGEQVVAALGGPTFRVYRNRDIVGVELAGALKNVIAIAAGAVEALGLGDNARAAIVTRGLAEITRLGVAAGASPLTFAGLAGIGDILATVASPLSRNHRLGLEVARGRPWAEVEAAFGGVAEGAHTVTAALGLAERLGVELPIAREVHAVLFEAKPVAASMRDLLARDPRDELEGLDR
ncbi:MAG: NAD(P)H-dependent glycerol-3-phosphate dehydrogenase [Candidatus Limnocylindrales bacterium]